MISKAETLIRMVDFKSAVKDSTGGQYKVKKRDYLQEGRIPIVDQGQPLVAGYTDDISAVFSGNLPVVLFGDHTLALKYVDYSFALGADGVKALSIHKTFNPKYLYYYWQSCQIQSRGYSRHFKFLREIKLPLIPLSEQRRIVEILDQADALRKKRAEADAKAARILPALFYKMFGDPVKNPKEWPVYELGNPQIAKINPRLIKQEISIDAEFSFVPMPDIDERWGRIIGKQTRPYSEVCRGFTHFQDGDVIFAKITPCMQNGKAAIVSNLKNGRGFGSTEFHVFRPGPLATPEWLFGLIRLNMFRKQAEASFTGSAGQQRVPLYFLKNYKIGCPPKELQQRFASAVRCIFQHIDAIETSSDELFRLFEGLLYRAFTRDLTAKWREAHMKELLEEMEQQARELELRKNL